LDLGQALSDGRAKRQRLVLADSQRTQHLAVLGKTGSGKSYLLRHIARQDIRARRGFVFFDLHGDVTPYLLGVIADKERQTGEDLSSRLILIEPADRKSSVGLNVLEGRQDKAGTHFGQIAEFAQVLKVRWGLDGFGARTEELLRNSLYVLADNGLTLLELPLLLTQRPFRERCLSRTSNSDVAAYFRSRYDTATDSMQAVLREALLNKVSAFISDPRFRHILGHERSTFDLAEVIDQGRWLVLNLDRGKLGEQAATFGSLLLLKLKNALFARRSRHLLTLFCDEIQNLLAYDSGVDTLLSEARKFGISLITANQFLDQYPRPMRSAILSVGAHVFFQLSSSDADRIAHALGGGRILARILKSLPPRQAVVKMGHERWRQIRIADVDRPKADISDLYRRCRERWTRPRHEIEQTIETRHALFRRSANEVLHDWE
jgi:energy-coupling factor transporter ATP-binding protein EcfA2